MGNFKLGLDLGANSIGWAIIDEEAQTVVAAGVRIFPEGVDNFDTKKEMSKTEARRDARGARRQTARRARRMGKLRRALVAVGLLPQIVLRGIDDADRVKWEGDAFSNADPYVLRQKALSEKLELHDIGRVLMHLNRRRGFLSNRKTDGKKKADDKGILAEMSHLAAAMKEAGHRTLGEHLATLHEDPHCRLRKRHTRREMFEAEFETIWEAQRAYYPNLLTDALKYGTEGKQVYPCKQDTPDRLLSQQLGIHGLVFFQRKMYWPKSVIGRCELEPHEKRCPRADRLAQRFRLLQEVNNLRYIDTDSGEVCQLSPEHRTLLLYKLSRKKEMKFDEIRKALGFIPLIRFNLEEGGRDKLKGMETDALLGKKSIFGPGWHEKAEAQKNEIVRVLVDPEAEEPQIYDLAMTQWGLDKAGSENLLDAVKDLPQGQLHLSRLALTKLLPHMERGLLLMGDDHTPSAMSEAGYTRPDQQKRHGVEILPEPPKNVTNPVVRQALFEVRKVVNAIIREYGKPARIHIELARNAKASGEERQKMSQRMRDREAQRDRAADAIREHGVKVTRDAINRYLLWEEQERACVYSGQPISVTQLLGGEADIDHILPYSRCLDDSMNNKVVCFRSSNAQKGQRTPWEWLGTTDPARFEQVRQWVSRLPFAKRAKFTQKELKLDDFIQRQLNDTRYISVVVMDYLRCLVAEPHYVLCPKGEHTASLRWQWGLNTILREDGQDQKNRDDHRHHAVDAIILALTDQSRLQQLSRRGDGEILPEPWPGFRGSVEKAVNSINVSHRVQRKVAGALHEETLYGPTEEKGTFVVRKPLESLTPGMIEDIRDEAIKKLVIARLKERQIEFGRGKSGSIPPETWKPELTMASGVPVRKVRIFKSDLTIQPIREGSAYVKPGSTHHVCIFEWEDNGKTKRDAVFVTMLEAIRRVRRKKPIIQHNHPDRPDARFLFSLSAGEYVSGNFKGKERLVCYKTGASTQGQLYFAAHTDARRGSDYEKLAVNANTLRGRKVTVDPLGRIRWAND